MTNVDFNPFGTESIIVKFTCDNCDHEVTSDDIYIPSPNYAAETASDSYNDNDGSAICENCSKEFEITVYVSYAGGSIDIQDIDDDDVIEVIENQEKLDEYYDEQINSIIFNSGNILSFITELENLKKLNNETIGDTELQNTLKRQLYSGAITCLEDFLSQTLIKAVLSNEKFFKNFVRTFPGINARKFSLSEIFEKQQGLKDIVKKELLDIMYHNLPKVKPIYKNTLGIEFPDIADLIKIVLTRHDMVHRNGKSKDGAIIEINKDIVDDVINKVEAFAKDIEMKFADIDKNVD